MLDDAASGRFPAVDGTVEVFAPEPDGPRAIVEFTGRAIVLGHLPLSDLVEMGADGFGGASRPEIKLALAGPDGWVGSHDAVLVSAGRGDAADSMPLQGRTDLEDHPRVIRSRAHRRNVEAFADRRGVVTLGTGLVGRTEMSVELFDDSPRGTSTGRALIAAGLVLVPADEFVWAQVSPGNAASLRAFLASGFVPVGAETLIVPQR